MSVPTVDPRFLPFIAWADAVVLESSSILPQAGSEDSWKAWATQVAGVDTTVPDPIPFADWRSWALAWIAGQ